MSPTVQVILPVLDEAGALPWILPRIPDGYKPLVVDNGSTDGSADIARDLGAQVIHAPIPGFGSACWAGLTAATSDVVTFMDADASLDPAELPMVTNPVLAGTSDLMLGRRVATKGAWPLSARIANRVLVAELRRRYEIRLADLGPMRSARREALLQLGIVDRRFGWPLEMVLRAHRAGWRIGEVDVAYRPRIGNSKVTGTVRGTVRAVRDMAGLLT